MDISECRHEKLKFFIHVLKRKKIKNNERRESLKRKWKVGECEEAAIRYF